MAKRVLMSIVTAIFMITLTACSIQNPFQFMEQDIQYDEEQTNETGEGTISDTNDMPTQDTQEQTVTEDVHTEADDTGVCTEYAYLTLDETEKTVYKEILDSLLNLAQEQKVSTKDVDVLNKVFQCVLNDHPEIFYVNGYQYKLYTLQDEITKIVFEGEYTKSAVEIENDKEKIKQYVDECLASFPEDASEYEKVKYLYEYIIFNTEYSNQSKDSQNICSVFIDRYSVCQGYAKAMQYLCNQAGIAATLVTGYANGEGHAWNMVTVDGDNYYVDVTWGDASYVFTGTNSYEGAVPPITYDYLLVTTDMLEDTHQIDNIVEMPVCTAIKDNYYVKENLFFTEYDEEKLKNVFLNAAENGRQYVTLKCSDKNIYNEMKQKLISNQKVFDYLAGITKSIAYSENSSQLTMSFWLNETN